MVSVRDPRVEFCEREYRRLVGGLALYTGDADVAQDLAHEALARACRHWRRVSDMDQPGAWLWRVAINLANRSFATRRARRSVEEAISIAPDDQAADVTEALVVRAAVAALPRRQRAAVVLRFYLDLPVGEVASLMSCRPGTVKALTHQGVQGLRQRLLLDFTEEVSP